MARINLLRQAQDKPQKIIIIVGPTASGKSGLAIKLAKKFKGEIISADSRQVYRGMNIGTGKVTKKEQRIAKHYLLDVANPKKQFTANDFKKLGEKIIIDLASRYKLPIIVGGTGFYIDILLGRMAVAQVPPNKKLRAELEKQSAEQLFRRLSVLDPQHSKIIDGHNKRRLIRALEIIYTQKVSLKLAYANFRDTENSENYRTLWLGVNPGKEKLAQNIKKRLDDRLRPSFAKASEGKEGMVEEVKKLHKQGVSWKRLDGFGLEYRWISRWLKKSKFNIPYSKFSDSDEYQNLLRDIIRYSKRQMTWFKRNKEINWVDNNKTAEQLTQRFID